MNVQKINNFYFSFTKPSESILFVLFVCFGSKQLSKQHSTCMLASRGGAFDNCDRSMYLNYVLRFTFLSSLKAI